jgi:hypothetical protein
MQQISYVEANDMYLPEQQAGREFVDAGTD